MNKREVKSRDMKLLSEYRQKLLKLPDLKFLFFELTDKCNMACRHCGSRCSAGNEKFIDTHLVKKTLDTVAEDFGGQQFMICLTGGEPLLHPDFEEIVEYINHLDIPWGMTTNGVLIDEVMAKKLVDLEMGSITLSLDGMKDSHEWLRCSKGSFDKTIAAIRNLKKYGKPVQVTTVVNKRNKDELDEIYTLMRELNVDSWRVVNVDPIGRALETEDLSLTSDEIVELLYYIREKRFDNTNPMDVCFGCSHYLSYEFEREVRDFYFQCGSGTTIASILVNGDVYGCLDIERRPELVQGNVSTDRFSTIWINNFDEYRADRSMICEKCAKCDEREFCGGESMHTWDFEKNSPLICLKEKIHEHRI